MRNAFVFDGRLVWQSSFGQHLWDGNYLGAPGDQLSRLLPGGKRPDLYMEPFLQQHDDEIAWNRDLMRAGFNAILVASRQFIEQGFRKFAYLWNMELRPLIRVIVQDYRNVADHRVLLLAAVVWLGIAGLFIPGIAFSLLLLRRRGVLAYWKTLSHVLLVSAVSFVSLGLACYHIGLMPAFAAHVSAACPDYRNGFRVWRLPLLLVLI